MIDELEELKKELEKWKTEHHKRQVAEDAALQTAADLKADHEMTLGKLRAEHDEVFANVRSKHNAAMAAKDQQMADMQRLHRIALLKEKQRVDIIEFQAKQAVEVAAIQG